MNAQYLRQSLKAKWLNYYRENRLWLTRLGVWVDCGGQRRPSSGFILATLSTLEPQLTTMLPLIVDLSHNPDRIVMALGLNFNPDEELKLLEAAEEEAMTEAIKMLPSGAPALNKAVDASPPVKKPQQLPSLIDESCHGVWGGEADGGRE